MPDYYQIQPVQCTMLVVQQTLTMEYFPGSHRRLCSITRFKFQSYLKNGQVIGRTSTEVPDMLVQLLEPDVSVLDLPEPLPPVGLCVPRCLDDVSLGLLLVLLQ